MTIGTFVTYAYVFLQLLRLCNDKKASRVMDPFVAIALLSVAAGLVVHYRHHIPFLQDEVTPDDHS